LVLQADSPPNAIAEPPKTVVWKNERRFINEISIVSKLTSGNTQYTVLNTHLLSFHILLLVIFLVIAAGYIPQPIFVFEVPVNGFFNSLFELK
jgi:hypothetical protein